jgi:hypothetical protein
MSRTSPFRPEGDKVWNRRNLAVHHSFGKGRESTHNSGSPRLPGTSGLRQIAAARRAGAAPTGSAIRT